MLIHRRPNARVEPGISHEKSRPSEGFQAFLESPLLEEVDDSKVVDHGAVVGLVLVTG
jgi:hypothetical protein